MKSQKIIPGLFIAFIVYIIFSGLASAIVQAPPKENLTEAAKYVIRTYLLNENQTRFSKEDARDFLDFYTKTKDPETADFSAVGEYSGKTIDEIYQKITASTTTTPCTGLCTTCVQGAQWTLDQGIATCDAAKQWCYDNICGGCGDIVTCWICNGGCDTTYSTVCVPAAKYVYTEAVDHVCCTDFDSCTTEKYDESSNSCVHTLKSCGASKTDGCCPMGCTAENDKDCAGESPSGSTTTTTLDINCPSMSCEEILADEDLREAVETYDVNKDGAIDDSEAKAAFDDYTFFNKISQNQACAVILFYKLGCDLFACAEGGVCQYPGQTCCEDGVQYSCESGTTPTCKQQGETCETATECCTGLTCTQGVCAIEITPPQGTINLPLCTFYDTPGVWAKPKDCSWDHRAMLGGSDKASCNTYLIATHSTQTSSYPYNGWIHTWGPAAIGESTDLCTTDPNYMDLPRCPFAGTTGDVWAKPDIKLMIPLYGTIEWEWDSGKCKLGSQCVKKYELKIPGVQQKVPGIKLYIGPIKIIDWSPEVGTVGARVETHADTPQRVYCGTKLLVVLTGESSCDVCVVRPSECTSGQCDLQYSRICLPGGTWSPTSQSSDYCKNCEHCGNGKCESSGCEEDYKNCPQDCRTPSEECTYLKCEQENTLPCACGGLVLPAGYKNAWCCGGKNGGDFETQKDCYRNSACGTCDDYCKMAGSSEGACSLACTSGWWRPDTDYKCTIGHCCCKGSAPTESTTTTIKQTCKDYCAAMYKGVEGDCKLWCPTGWFAPSNVIGKGLCTLGRCCCKKE